MTTIAFGTEDFSHTFDEDTLSRIPTLKTLCSTSIGENENFAYKSIPEPIIKPIIKYAETEDEHYLLSKTPTTLDIGTVLSAVDELCMQMPDIDIDTIKHDLTDCESPSQAKTTAGIFALGLYHGNFVDVASNRMFQLIEFVVSHPRIFNMRVRHHIHTLYSQTFKQIFTKKQNGIIATWFIKFHDYETDDESSTDDEFDYDSDPFD